MAEDIKFTEDEMTSLKQLQEDYTTKQEQLGQISVQRILLNQQIFFGVKSDFSMEDIFRYIDFCFTQLCFGIIYIENMKLTSNHYRVFPSLLAF